MRSSSATSTAFQRLVDRLGYGILWVSTIQEPFDEATSGDSQHMHFQPFTTILLLMLALMPSAGIAIGQESASEPIYLEEPEPEPPARAGKRRTIKEKYDDDSVRVERQIVKLSDDRIVNDGKYIEYYPDGKKYVEGSYKMGAFDGDWQYWFPNGQLCKKVTFKLGRTDGQWEVFDQEGTRTAQQSYREGRRHGKWISYFEGGEQQLFEVTYEDGKPVGERITYFETGQKRTVIPFKDGKFHGTMVEYDESGTKIAELDFKDGKREGKVRRLDE
ncbi:MAG: toxin-antitoxin system YwqK family antitoxin [Planctomycetota bacterium]